MPDVFCPHCGESWLETTNEFSRTKTIHAAMFRLKKKYRDEGWPFCGVHSGDVMDSIEGGNVSYPCCSNVMCDGNNLFNGIVEQVINIGRVGASGNGRIYLSSNRNVRGKPKKAKLKYTCEVCGRGWSLPGPYNGHMRGKCGKKG